MACRKCGSSWLTKTGKDCSSCPHCCKQQRCKARKQGRWKESSDCQKSCAACGKLFSSTHNNQKCCGSECQKAHRDQWLAKWRPDYQKQYKAGRRRGTQSKASRLQCTCPMCGISFKRHGPKKYCSRACFAAARKAGIQAWDRTAQTEATWHRGGQWKNAPSKAHIASVDKLYSWLAKASALCGRMWRLHQEQRHCHVCGTACNRGASRFCSYECNKAWRGERQCLCGNTVCDASAFGRPPLCKECIRESRRLQKRMYGSYRRRCRTYGGRYNAAVKPKSVFERDRWRCHVCGKKTHPNFSVHDPRSATVDHHPIPLSKGGDHDWHNVRCCCFRCNSLKGAKWDGQQRIAFA